MPVPRSPKARKCPESTEENSTKIDDDDDDSATISSTTTTGETCAGKVITSFARDRKVRLFSPEFIGACKSGVRNSRKHSNSGESSNSKPVFKMLRTDSKLIKAVLHGHGFRQSDDQCMNFDILWSGNHLRAFCLRSLTPDQRVNHFPRSFELTRKDRLYRNVERMQIRCGKENFGFVPEFFVTPQEFQKFSQHLSDAKVPFIVKPVGSSRGRGIFVALHAEQIPLGSEMLVSEYITNPFLVQGHKFDIRLYVAVTSIHPLVFYLYQDGLARFAAKKYNPNFRSYNDTCIHLTNYSLNKHSDKYIRNQEGDAENTGHKWALSGLLRHLKEKHNADTTLLMLRIEDLIVKTVLSCQSPIAAACLTFVPYEQNCFEVFGFDVLIDSHLKPWLLEVNLSPSLSCDTPLDFRIKSGMVCDLMSLAGIPSICEKETAEHDELSEKELDKGTRESLDDSGALRKESSADMKESVDLKIGVKIRKNRTSRRATAALKSARKQRIQMLKRQTLHGKGNTTPTLSKNRSLESLTDGHVRRVLEEEQRRGKFIRLFPQPHTWTLYSGFLDDLGASRNFDEKLHRKLFPQEHISSRHGEYGVEEAVRAVLRDTGLAKSLNSAPSDCIQFLAESIKRAAVYEKKAEAGPTKHGSYAKLRFQPNGTFRKSEEQRKRNRTWSNTGQDVEGSNQMRHRVDTNLSELVIDNPKDAQELMVPLPPIDHGNTLAREDNPVKYSLDLVDKERFCE